MVAKKRKKNPGVGIDFKRAKLKVGKKLPKARNATDTSFKAQSISLPGQNALTEDRSGLAVSDRNLTLKVGAADRPVLAPHIIHQVLNRCMIASHRNSWGKWATTASASGRTH